MKRLIITLVTLFSLFSAHAQLNKPYFFVKGREYIIEGRYREAIESLNLLLRTDSKIYEGYFLRGVAKYNLDDLTGATADFTHAISENPVYTLAYQYRAITRSRMGLYNEALEDFNKAINLRPNHAPSYYSRGVAYLLNRQFDKAIADYNQFLKLDPYQPDAYINRGTCYLYMNDTVKAIRDYERAIEVNPYYSDGFLRRGLIALMKKEFKTCVAYMDKAVELNPTFSIAYFYRGLAKSSENQLIAALDDFDNSILCDSTNSVTYFNRAILRSQIGDYNRAIEDYNKLAIYNPGNVLVFYNRAAVNIQIGNYNDAIRDYSRAIELYPDFANAYRYRSQIKAMMGDRAGSEKDMKIAQAKIAEYRSKLTDSTFSAYADTSKQFNKLLSFDADFGSRDFGQITGDARREFKLMPLFRFTVVKADSSISYSTIDYRNARLERFLAEAQIPGLKLDSRETDLDPTTIERLDAENQYPQKWSDVFYKGITQGLVKQYSSAKSLYDFSIVERPKDPFAYINRSTTQAEMIEFIASLDGNYQNVNIEIDPAARLKEGTKRQYDYSSAIADLRQAAELMPELPHIYYNLGNLLCLSGDMPAAIVQYNKAISLYPYFAEAYFNRGLVQIFLKDTQTGCMDMSKAGELGIPLAYDVVKKYCIQQKQ